MFLVMRTLTLKKGFVDSYVDRFNRPGLVNEFPGFVRKEVHVNQQSSEVDIVRVAIYWGSKEDFIAWERSPQHMAQHQAHKGEPKPVEIISSQHEMYTVYESSTHVAS